ncbi:MAG: NusG domain II-containing protein [Clostridia bacterium]|nr:NusG domain II-containing protein [Clostridia bacterium]
MATENKKIRNDIILIAAVLALLAALGAGLMLFRPVGDTVSVTVDGKLYGTYSLGEDARIEIVTEQGYNILVIKDGRAHVESASCPDGICAEHRPVSRGGESIICLPNKVVISVKKTDNDGPDVIS